MPPRGQGRAQGQVEVDQLDALIQDLTGLKTAIQAHLAPAAAAVPVGLQQAAAPLQGATLANLCSWARKIVAQANGYLEEHNLYFKHRNKGRVVEGPADQGMADLLVGRDAATDPFAKSYQIKAVATNDSGAVETHIKKALWQLGGSGFEFARPTDRWSVNIHIRHPENPWPFSAFDAIPQDPNAFRVQMQKTMDRIWVQALQSAPSSIIKNRLIGHAMGDWKTPMVAASVAGAPFGGHTTAVVPLNGKQKVQPEIVVKIYYTPPYDLGDQRAVWKVVARLFGKYQTYEVRKQVARGPNQRPTTKKEIHESYPDTVVQLFDATKMTIH